MPSHQIKSLGQRIKFGAFLAGPILFLYLVFFVELDKNNPAVSYTLAVAVLMALWWITEIVPLAVTSLLPIILFPVLGVMNGKLVASNYFNDIIFLFLADDDNFIAKPGQYSFNLNKGKGL